MKRFRLVMLKLTVGAGGLLLLMWIAMQVIRFIGICLGNTGCEVGTYFLQVNTHDCVLMVYRKGFPWIGFGYTMGDYFPWAVLYALLCVFTFSLDSIILVAEKRKARQIGFEVVVSNVGPKDHIPADD